MMKSSTKVLAESGMVGMVVGLGITALYNIGCPKDVIIAYLEELQHLATQGEQEPENLLIVEMEDIEALDDDEDPNLPETKPEAGL